MRFKCNNKKNSVLVKQSTFKAVERNGFVNTEYTNTRTHSSNFDSIGVRGLQSNAFIFMYLLARRLLVVRVVVVLIYFEYLFSPQWNDGKLKTTTDERRRAIEMHRLHRIRWSIMMHIVNAKLQCWQSTAVYSFNWSWWCFLQFFGRNWIVCLFKLHYRFYCIDTFSILTLSCWILCTIYWFCSTRHFI